MTMSENYGCLSESDDIQIQTDPVLHHLCALLRRIPARL